VIRESGERPRERRRSTERERKPLQSDEDSWLEEIVGEVISFNEAGACACSLIVEDEVTVLVLIRGEVMEI
jgi:hypothetical protein